MKAVIDTNVLINALNDKNSIAWQILELATTDKVEFFASPKIINEYKLVIDREVASVKDKQELNDFISAVHVAPVTHRVKAVKFDPEDDKFLDIALSVGAEYIISSDAHLVELEEYEGVKILKPDEFWYKYRNESDENGDEEWKKLFGEIFK
ncbi:MAG: putative toxin-antitoxin system toxin component, PIN family [Patescibacteria group bacterium]|nr:putative toxin-antitoxin system toxin component, PIN family [Patescibacteria group bacterium]